MQTQLRRVRPNEGEAVGQLIDGEAILINLVTGTYYSMDGIGALIWSMIEAGDAVDTIVASLARDCNVTTQRASEDVDRLIAELIEQRLVVPADHVAVEVQTDRQIPTEDRDYVTPMLNIYTDMEELLALDPPVPGFEDISWEKRRA